MDPRLPLTEPMLDPAGERRSDPRWLAAQWRNPRARVVMVAGERVRVHPDTQMSIPRVQWLAPAQLPVDDEARYPGDWVFLGLAADATPYFGVSATEQLPDDELIPVRQLGLSDASATDMRIVVGALAVLNWHRRHRRCPLCGDPTDIGQGGWVRRCPTDDSQHFPRVDPAVIMLVIDAADRALLGRQSRWPQGWLSTLAGFVEPGETLENAVTREVLEEVGVEVGDVTYLASQPWPFPSSLMLGFHATAHGTDIRPDHREIAEARWFTRDELAQECSLGAVRLPPRFSISRWLIEQWFGADLPGDWSRE